MILVEGPRSVHVASAASLVEEGRELAWAEKHVIHNPAFAWVLGKYVGTNTPNDNGHIFDADDLRVTKDSLVHAPMNMLHVPHKIMGVFVANELVYPVESAATESYPDLEALAAFWKYYFQNDFALVKKAHEEGTLAWSMEAVPQTVTCAQEECGNTYPYDGRTSPTYCAHLQQPQARKKLNKPHFTAGALVVPPARPAWKGANVTELSSLIKNSVEAAQTVYDQTKAEFPEMDTSQHEALMLQLMAMAERRSVTSPNLEEARRRGQELAKEFSEDRRKKLANKGHARSDGSFPIESIQDLKNAIRAVGRAKNPAAAKAHIKKRARALGAAHLVPKDW